MPVCDCRAWKRSLIGSVLRFASSAAAKKNEECEKIGQNKRKKNLFKIDDAFVVGSGLYDVGFVEAIFVHGWRRWQCWHVEFPRKRRWQHLHVDFARRCRPVKTFVLQLRRRRAYAVPRVICDRGVDQACRVAAAGYRTVGISVIAISSSESLSMCDGRFVFGLR